MSGLSHSYVNCRILLFGEINILILLDCLNLDSCPNFFIGLDVNSVLTRTHGGLALQLDFTFMASMMSIVGQDLDLGRASGLALVVEDVQGDGDDENDKDNDHNYHNRCRIVVVFFFFYVEINGLGDLTVAVFHSSVISCSSVVSGTRVVVHFNVDVHSSIRVISCCCVVIFSIAGKVGREEADCINLRIRLYTIEADKAFGQVKVHFQILSHCKADECRGLAFEV